MFFTLCTPAHKHSVKVNKNRDPELALSTAEHMLVSERPKDSGAWAAITRPESEDKLYVLRTGLGRTGEKGGGRTSKTWSWWKSYTYQSSV